MPRFGSASDTVIFLELLNWKFLSVQEQWYYGKGYIASLFYYVIDSPLNIRTVSRCFSPFPSTFFVYRGCENFRSLNMPSHNHISRLQSYCRFDETSLSFSFLSSECICGHFYSPENSRNYSWNIAK